jgi:hypothetical protein
MSLLTLSLLPLAVAVIAAGIAFLYVPSRWQPGAPLDPRLELVAEAAKAVAVVAGLAWLGMYGLAQMQDEPDRPPTARERFCSKHRCIGDWQNARGYRVQCADGAYSFSGGVSGSCSGHGGNGGFR